MAPRILFTAVVLTWGIAVGLVSAPAPAPAQPGDGAFLPGPESSSDDLPQDPDNDTCLACHNDPEAKAEDGRSIAVDPSRFAESLHGAMGMTCTACHADLAGAELPHAATLAKVNCASCHEAAVAAYDRSIHAAARRQTPGSVAATCVDCHSAHEVRASTDPASMTYALNLPQTCSRCHGDAAIIERGHIAAGNVADLFKDSIHGRAISRSGLLVAANCTSCHGAHDILPKNNPDSRVYRANIPGTCATCHEGIQSQFMRGSHGQALADGSTKGPVCTDCHSAHQIQRADTTTWRLDTIAECGTCHSDKIKTYRDTFHGQVTSLGFVRVAKCADCHGAHEVHPKSDARSMVSPERVLATCQTCHADATPAFVDYDPHADRDDVSRNPELYYASRFMHWLLIGVFGFFGVHALLWLPRSYAERRSRAKASPPAPEEDR